jgi:hypothetical protein
MKIVKPSKMSPCAHGTKYENEAISMYKVVSGNNVVEIDKSIHRHTKHTYITGQVDGIVTLDDGSKVVLEVKCPKGEKLDPSNFTVSSLYWVQVQIYMELLEIENAHYCEYYRFDDNNTFFRWKEIPRDKVWFNSLVGHMDKMVELVTTPQIIGKKRKRSDSKQE